jgi:ABC-type dipeptide/oligopeptide/nickel transport system permease subunit
MRAGDGAVVIAISLQVWARLARVVRGQTQGADDATYTRSSSISRQW